MSGSTTRDSSTPPAPPRSPARACRRASTASNRARKEEDRKWLRRERAGLVAWWPGSGSSLDVDAEPLADRRDLVIATHLEDQRASSLEIDAQVDGLVSMVPSPKAATEWNRGPLEPLAKHPSMTNASASAMSLSCCASEAGSTPCCSTSTTAPSPPPSRLRGRDPSRACAVEAGRAASQDLRRTAVTVQRAAQDRAGVCRVQLTRGLYLRRMRAISRRRVSCVRRGPCDTFRFSRSRSSPSSPRAARTRATRRRVEASSIA